MPVNHQLLSLYYHKVLTLRDYILSQLPSSSKARRRRITALIYQPLEISHAQTGLRSTSPSSSSNGDLYERECRDDDQKLAFLLDSTVVGVLGQPCNVTEESRSKDLAAFSQQNSSSVDSTLGSGLSPQTEVSQWSQSRYHQLCIVYRDLACFLEKALLHHCISIVLPIFFTDCWVDS